MMYFYDNVDTLKIITFSERYVYVTYISFHTELNPNIV